MLKQYIKINLIIVSSIFGLILLFFILKYLKIGIIYKLNKDKYIEVFDILGTKDNYVPQGLAYSDKYKTPVLTAGKTFILGYTNETSGIYTNLPTIIFDDFTTDSRYVDFPFKVKSSAMKILQVNKEVDIKYVAYFMSITRLLGDSHKRYWISTYSKASK